MMTTTANNLAPWAHTPPANPANVLREIGPKIDKEKRKELQTLLAEDKNLAADFERLCSDRALRENREMEFSLHADLSVTAEDASQKIRVLRQFAENAPVTRERIERQ